MNCKLAIDNRRRCDGQTNRMCSSQCDVDCNFNNAALDRVMNYPLRRVEPEVFQDSDIVEENRPYCWFAPPAWLSRRLVYAGVALGVAWGLYRYFF